MKIGRIIIIMSVMLSLATAYLAIHTQNMGIKYEIEELKRKLLSIHSKNRDLRSKTSKLKSLDRIEEIARKKLKMIKPEEINYIVPSTETLP